VGPFQVHWYGVMYAVAFLAAFRFGVLPYAMRRGVARSVAEKMTIWTIVFGLVGGRLYYVLQQPDLVNHFILQPQHLLAFWEGGMAFYGAIIAGFITLAISAWRYHINPWLALDGGVLFAVVGQPIGRLGNIINGDILGGPSMLPWATAYANPHALLQPGFSLCTDTAHPGNPLTCPAYQPAAAYEALAAVLIGVLLFALVRRRVRPGVLAMTYIAAYAISQLILFQVRKSEPVVLLGLHQAQWTSIGMLVIGLPLLYYLWRRTGTRFEAWQPQATSLPADTVRAQ
jgi:phosphatidylglycerol:prolipoprotein diacylglycerol transferase